MKLKAQKKELKISGTSHVKFQHHFMMVPQDQPIDDVIKKIMQTGYAHHITFDDFRKFYGTV